MVTMLSGDLGATASYTHRDFTWLGGLGWPDGRAGTLWLNHFTAKTRLGTKNRVSRYAVAEVKLVGFMGRAWVFDKEFPDDEYDGQSDRKPPYTVTLDQHGVITCQCMAAACKAPCCRHADAILALLAEGEFPEPVTEGA